MISLEEFVEDIEISFQDLDVLKSLFEWFGPKHKNVLYVSKTDMVYTFQFFSEFICHAIRKDISITMVIKDGENDVYSRNLLERILKECNVPKLKNFYNVSASSNFGIIHGQYIDAVYDPTILFVVSKSVGSAEHVIDNNSFNYDKAILVYDKN